PKMNASQNLLLFVVSIRRNNDRDWFVVCLLSGKTKKLFRSRIPAGDDSIEIFTDDRVVRRFNDGGELPTGFFVTFAFTNVAQIRCKNRGGVDLQSRDGEFDQNFRAILAHSRQLDPCSNHRPLARFPIMSQPEPMPSA